MVSFLLVLTSSPVFIHLSHVCYMPCPSHPPWITILRGVQIIKLLIMQFSPGCRYLIGCSCVKLKLMKISHSCEAVYI
jgi:hypothetical protein